MWSSETVYHFLNSLWVYEFHIANFSLIVVWLRSIMKWFSSFTQSCSREDSVVIFRGSTASRFFSKRRASFWLELSRSLTVTIIYWNLLGLFRFLFNSKPFFIFPFYFNHFSNQINNFSNYCFTWIERHKACINRTDQETVMMSESELNCKNGKRRNWDGQGLG